MKLICNKANPPLGGVIAAEYVKALRGVCVEIQWGSETVVDNCTQKYRCETSNDVLRVIARLLGEELLYGASAVEKSEVDSWLSFSVGPLASKSDFAVGVQHLNKILAPLTFLVGKRVTIADFAVFSALFVSKQWHALLAKKEIPVHVLRWYTFLQSQEAILKTLAQLPEDVKNALTPTPTVQGRQSLEKSVGRQQEGKFIELPGAEMGKVVVRFPPEASGYLHIGHAKAALLNQYYQQAFQGKLIMRFDDTNPAKENVHFEQVILEDLKMLEIKPDAFTHTSDYFDIMIDYCEKLLKEGKAYVDDTEPEVMKQEREQRVESTNRANAYEKNVALWEEMKGGTERGQKCCVRAKIDMQSANGCMRDPTIYRCKNEPHPRTGEKYKVYPTYDFACPIVDALEGVTHTLRTMEYHDRDPQFYWFIDALGLRKPHIWEYSRLSMTNTVLSKRKLAWFVEEKLVDGWDDPRFPTVRGVLRRGMTVEGLKQFIIAQGSSRSVVFMEWDKIWAFNKKVIDPIAPRFTAVEADSPAPVIVTDVKEEKLIVAKHPKNPDVGDKEVWIGSKLLIDRADADQLKEGENATFINWGNLLIKKIHREEDGKIASIEAEPNLENKDYKKTLKLTWLAETASAGFTPTWCVYFDHIVSKPLLGKDEDFKQFVGHDTRKEFEMLGDPELRKLKKGDIIQLQRRGFFIVDVPYGPASLFTCREQPVVLFYIPDGSVKENPVSAAAINKASGDNKKVKSSQEATRSKTTAKADVIKQDDIVNSSREATRSRSAVNADIIKQGDIVRGLKAQKAAKGEIEAAVKTLLALKSEYKTLTNAEWKPGCEEQKAVVEDEVGLKSQTSEREVEGADGISQKIARQGDRVRELKSKKADKAIVEAEVKTLLSLKAVYKGLTGMDWKPQAAPPVVSDAMPPSPVLQEERLGGGGGGDAAKDELVARVAEQGNAVRDLKASKAPKVQIDAAVKTLLDLKAEYKTLTGTDFPAPGKAESKSKEREKKQPKEKVVQQKSAATKEKVEESALKKQTRLGLEVKKEENLSEWYSQVITKGEMIEYYDVSGCYIFRPWAFAIWEAIREWLDGEIKKLGVQNCYFPIFVSKTVLEKEKTHIADFAPEVAWVTKSGESDLAEPIAVRPTSETVMYPAYAKWVQSYRDLPIKLNQWNNVVRWEFKHPQPFLRTREFLWQEGHTAYAVKAEAEAEVKVILDLYAQIYTDLLAVPVIKGKKTAKEKFAGGEYTFTVEAFVSASGRGIQGATSHHLGQNFSRMFDVAFEDPDTQEKVFVYQNSWGITTRTIGVMIMVHSDNQGLVLPPNVACIQTIIVPCGFSVSQSDEDRRKLLDSCGALEAELKNAGIKVRGDYRDNYSPGWKFNDWELKGVPVRVELGPKDIKNGQLVAVRRDTGAKVVLKREGAVDGLKSLLGQIQTNLYEKAKRELDAHVIVVTDWAQFPSTLDKKNMLLSPFCGESDCEDRIKAESAREDSDPGAPSMGAKSLCIPFAQPAEIKPNDRCVHPECKNKPLYYALFGRSY